MHGTNMKNVNLGLFREFNQRREKNLEVLHEYYRDIRQVQNDLFNDAASYLILSLCRTYIIIYSCAVLFSQKSVKFLVLTTKCSLPTAVFDQIIVVMRLLSLSVRKGVKTFYGNRIKAMGRQGYQICCCFEAGSIVNQPFHKPTSNIVERRGKEGEEEEERPYPVEQNMYVCKIYLCDAQARKYNTGRFIMFSMITNIYNKKTKGPALVEFFTATEKLKKFFFF